MEREFLRLAVWDQFTRSEADVVARALAKILPAPWRFDRVAEHACGDQRRQVAFFRHHDRDFAFIPGGAVVLGFDRSNLDRPELRQHRERIDAYDLPDVPEQFASDEAEDAFRSDPERQEFFNWANFFDWLEELPGPRRVELEPFLIEAEPISCFELASGATFASLVAMIERQGLRLPTSDEWEHARAAGSRTIWPWGNECSEDYNHEDEGDDLIHYQPNAFGLRYHGDAAELVVEPGVRRNTDGGVAMCGGEGFRCGWLSLASANVRDYYALGWDNPERPLQDGINFRRAFSIPTATLD